MTIAYDYLCTETETRHEKQKSQKYGTSSPLLVSPLTHFYHQLSRVSDFFDLDLF